MQRILFLTSCWILFSCFNFFAQSVPQFETDVMPILSRYCIHCHGPLDPMGSLDMTNPLFIEKGGVNGPALVKHSPEASLLHQRALDGSMPPAGQKRPSDDEIETIRKWIGAGAPTIKFYKVNGQTGKKQKETNIVVPTLSAKDRRVWAFTKLKRQTLPHINHSTRARTPVDTFLLSSLENIGTSLSPDANRETQIRRLYLDLLGLPPSPEAIDGFLKDGIPGAYERLVDRVLASPHFGERWGRHWLDEAGHTDTLGIDNDFVIGQDIFLSPGKWKYRDYVVDALNADIPYDRFLLEQIAGDELLDWRSATVMTEEMKRLLKATGFLRVAADDTNQGVLNTPDIRYGILQRTVQTFSSNVLGLTIGCAQCHDHKYDPISQLDYYRLTALFTPAFNPQRWLKPAERALSEVSPAEKEVIEKDTKALEKKIKPFLRKLNAIYHPYKQQIIKERLMQIPKIIRSDLETALYAFDNELRPAQQYLKEKFGPVVTPTDEELDKLLTPDERNLVLGLKNNINSLEKYRQVYGTIQAVVDTGDPPPTYFLIRGNYLTPGPEITPGVPKILTNSKKAFIEEEKHPGVSSGRRLALARWLTNPKDNAINLVARVRVNRIWQRLFGTGIVATSDNFGRNGMDPTHPELLDWLSHRFISGGWRVKPLIRTIVNSTVYRQVSGASFESQIEKDKLNNQFSIAFKKDPDNKLLWKMPLRRAESEVIRDSIMTVSGKLNRTMGGKPVKLNNHPNGMVTISKKGLNHPGDQWRRSIYLSGRRNYNLTMLSVFDQPKLSSNCTKRNSSAVVLQTLTMLNNEFVMEQARLFAEKLFKDSDKEVSEQIIKRVFRIALARNPKQQEIKWSQDLLQSEVKRHLLLGDKADKAKLKALTSFCQMILNSNEFLYIG